MSDSTGVCGDGGYPGGGLAVLEHPIVYDHVFCPACKRADTRFVIEYGFVNKFAELVAFLGTFVCCGDERVAEFTRSVSEGE